MSEEFRLHAQLHDVTHNSGVVKARPREFCRDRRIMLERKKSQIVHPPMLLQIIDEPRRPKLFRSRPADFNVFVHSLKRWPTQLSAESTRCSAVAHCKIECGVIFRQHELAIGLLAHLEVRDGIAALLQIRQSPPRHFRGCHTSIAIGTMAGNPRVHAAGEEQIDPTCAALLIPRSDG